MSQDIAEQNIQMWKVKKLIKSLDAARGYDFFFPPRSFERSSIFFSLVGLALP